MKKICLPVCCWEMSLHTKREEVADAEWKKGGREERYDGKKINRNECLVSAGLVLIFGEITQAKSSEIIPAVGLKE